MNKLKKNKGRVLNEFFETITIHFSKIVKLREIRKMKSQRVSWITDTSFKIDTGYTSKFLDENGVEYMPGTFQYLARATVSPYLGPHTFWAGIKND